MANQTGGKALAEKTPAAKLFPLAVEPCDDPMDCKTKFELYGVAQINKKVASCIKCGRIYLPLDWVGKRVKIIRMD